MFIQANILLGNLSSQIRRLTAASLTIQCILILYVLFICGIEDGVRLVSWQVR